ncbi:MAG: hypothetical protein ACO3JL_10945 [Myxococcota bacterium]
MKTNGRRQFLVRFGYDGSRFHGLQPQGTLPTAGATLRARIEAAALQRARALSFAARTDAGVHALQNAATFWLGNPLDVADFLATLQQSRDDGLWLVRGEEVPLHIHARGSSRGKRYRYRIEYGVNEGEDGSRYEWSIVPPLDVAAMREAAQSLVGTHDFSSFRAPRCSSSTPVKTVAGVRVSEQVRTPRGSWVVLVDIVGDAFLRKMVRIVVGTLAEVGVGLRAPSEMAGVLAARNRAAAGIAAPARGLTLMQVGLAWPEDGSALVRELSHDVAQRSTPAPLRG